MRALFLRAGHYAVVSGSLSFSAIDALSVAEYFSSSFPRFLRQHYRLLRPRLNQFYPTVPICEAIAALEPMASLDCVRAVDQRTTIELIRSLRLTLTVRIENLIDGPSENADAPSSVARGFCHDDSLLPLSIETRGRFDLLPRHLPRDVTHLLARVVMPLARSKCQQLCTDIDERLATQPWRSGFDVGRTVA